jgi:hypothetical protein
MSVKRFKFVSPGIFLNEIDNSFLPATQDKSGPVIIGRTLRGPAMRPVKVESQAELVEMFGAPVPGGRANDVWREGNLQSPMYGTYAAMSYLRNNGPVTMVRLLGHEHEDRTSSGKSGWYAEKDAWALWVFPSGGISPNHEVSLANSLADPGSVTGTLAAIFYSDTGAPSLKGNSRHKVPTAIQGTNAAIQSVGDNYEFKMVVHSDNAATTEALVTTFNFDKRSSKFIRKVFNTNPALLNSNVIGTGNKQEYFLGQTFENNIAEYFSGSLLSTTGNAMGMVTRLAQGHSSGTKVGSDYRTGGGAAAGSSGWIFSQDLSADHASFAPAISATSTVTGGVARLFKIHALNSGEWESANLKISIADIKYARNPEEDPYGSFTVQVRGVGDNDIGPDIVEQFTNCNLNPNSSNYVKRKIGDQLLAWSESDRRYTFQGDYENQSRYIRIETDDDCDSAALDPQCLPFGFFGPPRLSTIIFDNDATSESSTLVTQFIDGNNTDPDSLASAAHKVDFYSGHHVKLQFPKVPTRATSESGSLSNRKQAYWGVYDLEPGSNKMVNASWADLMYPLPDGLAPGAANSLVEVSQFVFSLDDVGLVGTGNADAAWAEGKRAAKTSWSASGSDGNGANGSWSGSLDQGIDKFTMPLWGGFDGLNIKSLDPFAPDIAMAAASTDKGNYAYYSIRKAMDTCADSEVVEMNAMVAPGITNDNLNVHMTNICEARGDALAILDIGGGYKPRANRAAGAAFSTYGGTVDATLSRIEGLGINSSYACCYYPWVQVQDQANGASLWAPPSVVALGTMASSEAKSEVWFAPAGFTRGGLTEGSAGMPVTSVRDRLTSKDRDKLYAANVNPIATFPSEGIVIFGQKTMQVTPSALDRINVRRLMIYVKKEISKMAATTLFEPNIRSTWNNFYTRAEPFLRSVQIGMGLMDFKIILDETTTTPELIDRNIMYAKILLKPTRAIEFIAIDFVITDSGASFED